MTKKRNTVSLNKRLLTYFLIIAFLPVVVIGYFWFDSKLKDYKSEIGILKENYSSEKKYEIKSKILEVSNSIVWVQENPINSIAGCLRKQNESLDTIIHDLILDKSEGLELSTNITFPVFVYNGNHELIYSCNPYCEQLDLINKTEVDIPTMLEENDSENGLIVLKDSINEVDGLPLAIAIKSITDNGNEIVSIVDQIYFEDVIKCYLLDSISKLRYGKNEYIFVNTIDGKALISNGERNVKPIDILTSDNQVWKDIFKVQQSSANYPEGVYHTYVWELLDMKNKSTKTSYFSYYPKWQWVIGTGFYEDDVNIIIAQKRELLRDEFIDTSISILVYLILSALLCYFLVFLFYKPINKSIIQFTQFFNRASQDNVTIDKSQIKYREFAQMAEGANRMLAETERSHEELLRSEEKYFTTFKNSPDTILLTSLENAQIVEANDITYKITGYTRAELLDGEILAFDLWLNKSERKIYIEQLLKQKRVTNLEVDLKMKTGEIRRVLLSGEIVEFGGAKFVLSIARDITEYKNIKKEISALENRFRETLENINLIAIVLDINGNINFCNDYLLGLTGYTSEEIIGKNWFSLFIPDTSPEVEAEIFEKLKTGELVSHYENKIIKKNGEELDIIFNNTILRDADGDIVGSTSIGEDITERKIAETRLNESEKKYRTLYEFANDSILIMDHETFIDCNEFTLETFGCENKSEILHQSPSKFSPRKQPDGSLSKNKAKKYIDLAIQGKSQRFEWKHTKLNGEEFDAEVSLNRFELSGQIYVQAIVRNITESKVAQKKLKLSEERYRLISNVASDYMFSSHFNDDGVVTITWVGGAFEGITGYTPEEYYEMGGWTKTIHPDDVGINQLDLEKLNKNQKVVTELRTISKSGRTVWVRIYAHPIWDEEKKRLDGIYGAVQDITERKGIELEIFKLNEELELKVKQRTAELESFSYSISHDLRAPLRAIFGFSQILSSRHKQSLNEEGQQYMNYVVEASMRMEELINDLLTYSRLGRSSIEMTPIIISDLLDNTYHEFELKLNEINAIFSNKTEGAVISGDATLFRQVFVNIIENAITYRREDVVLEISIDVEDLDNAYILKIQDNGIGIEKQYWEKVFNVFQRLHSEDVYPGTGIGLASVKKAVLLMQGEVWLKSEIGVGTCFYIKLVK